MIGMETSHTKGRQRQRWRGSNSEGEKEEFYLFPNSLKLLQTLKDEYSAYIILYLCVFVRACPPPPSPSSDSEGSRADTGDSPLQSGPETLTLSAPLSTPQPPQSPSVPIETVMLLSWGGWDRSGFGSWGAG